MKLNDLTKVFQLRNKRSEVQTSEPENLSTVLVCDRNHETQLCISLVSVSNIIRHLIVIFWTNKCMNRYTIRSDNVTEI